jgi:disulfide bond formation protein DsbB
MKKINMFLFPWLVSLVATLGSLYFSEIMEFVPCTLCWYQRILMYPLSVLFAFGFFTRDRNLFKYTYPLILIGNVLSFYHYGMQKLGFGASMPVCSQGVSCAGFYINWFGFITIPLLSFVAFSLLHIYFWIQFINNKKRS